MSCLIIDARIFCSESSQKPKTMCYCRKRRSADAKRPKTNHARTVAIRHFGARRSSTLEVACYTPREASIFTGATLVSTPPRTLDVQLDHAEAGEISLLTELLALTKMNWNSTELINLEPITLSAARSVGSILRHVPFRRAMQSRFYTSCELPGGGRHVCQSFQHLRHTCPRLMPR